MGLIERLKDMGEIEISLEQREVESMFEYYMICESAETHHQAEEYIHGPIMPQAGISDTSSYGDIMDKLGAIQPRNISTDDGWKTLHNFKWRIGELEGEGIPISKVGDLTLDEFKTLY